MKNVMPTLYGQHWESKQLIQDRRWTKAI